MQPVILECSTQAEGKVLADVSHKQAEGKVLFDVASHQQAKGKVLLEVTSAIKRQALLEAR